MSKFKVGPIEGFIMECIVIAITIAGIIQVVNGNDSLILPCVLGGLFAVFNYNQLLRIFDKTELKHYGKTKRAFRVLRNTRASKEKRDLAVKTLTKAANEGYTPAKDILDYLSKNEQM